MSRADFISSLKFRMQQMATAKRLPNRNKVLPKWLHPVPIEHEYQRDLVRYISELSKILYDSIIPHLPSLIAERNIEINVDGWAENAQHLFAQIENVTGEPLQKIKDKIPNIANKTNVWNNRQWQKTLKAAFGVDILQREPWLNESLNSWSMENASLITKMGSDHITDVSNIVQRGIRDGQTHKEIAKQIREKTGVSKKRAKVIGRDQVSKLNGNLTNLRQTEIGVKKYKWHDSDDERVRKTHRANDGKIFEWAKPPEKTGHPGHDVQCRCWAEAIFDEIFDEIKMESPELMPKGEPDTIVRAYKTKASAQSQRSRKFRGADLKYNSTTGKWELHIKPTTKPIVPPKPPLPDIPPDILPFAPPPEPTGQGFIVKAYKTKASAQSQKSRRFRNAILKYNDKTGKWELHIPTGIKPIPKIVPKPIPKPKPEIKPIPKPEPKPIPTSEKYGDIPYTVIDDSKRPEFRTSHSMAAQDTIDTGLFSSYTENKIRKLEDKIRFNNYESGSVTFANLTGPLKLATQKDKTSVVLTFPFKKNGIMIHNHPLDFTFSGQDIWIAMEKNLLQARAVTPKTLFTLTKTKKDWLTKSELRKWYAGNTKNFRQAYARDVQVAFNNGRHNARILRRSLDIDPIINRTKYQKLVLEEQAKELAKVTKKYADRHGWRFDIIDLRKSGG